MAKTYSLTRSCDTTSQSINQSEAIQSGINDTVTVRSTKQCYSTEKDRWVFSRCWNDRRVDADDVTSSRSEFQCRSSSHVLTFPISKLSLPSPSHDQRNSFMNHQWGHVPRGRWVFYKRAFSAHTQKRTQAPVFSTAFCTSANSWSTISQNDTQHLSWTQSRSIFIQLRFQLAKHQRCLPVLCDMQHVYDVSTSHTWCWAGFNHSPWSNPPETTVKLT